MNKLSPLDQIFYLLDMSGMPVMMCGAMIVDPTDSPYPLDGKILADHIAARMEKIPLMRQKVAQDVLKIGNMKLVDDPGFDVKNHISIARLKQPGGYKELTEHLGEFSAQRLDLSRPLWQYEVIEGLEGGRFAVAIHIHHCILDGVGATEALGSVWDTKPVPAEQPSSGAWQVKEGPTPFSLLWDAVNENAERMYVNTPAFLLKSSSSLLNLLVKKLAANPDEEKKPTPDHRVKVPKVHKTSLNPSKLSSKRAISYVEFPLKQIKMLGRHYGCSVNDLMILFSSYALQHYFETIGEPIDFDLVTALPINTRKSGDPSHGNKLSAARLSLHNRIEGIEERLHAIVRDTAAIKQPKKSDGGISSSVDGGALMGLFSPLILEGLIYGVVKFNLMEKLPLLNFAITNVPGYPVPIYIAGARQISTVPMAPIADTAGLTITISSTDSNVVIGFHGCGEAIKDKELFVDGAQSSFEALIKAAKLEPVASDKMATTPKETHPTKKPAAAAKAATASTKDVAASPAKKVKKSATARRPRPTA